MTDDHELDPVERLRAADPAAGIEPHVEFADQVVARATADTSHAGSTTIAAVPVVDLTAERARRRPRWLTVAAVAASIAVVGVAGYGVGASTGGASTVADGAAPPISLPGVTAEGATEPQSAAGGFAGAAIDRSKMSADSMVAYGFGRNSFRAGGLSTTDGTAIGYGYDARGASNAETVGALAAALGVGGVPELMDGAWIVGPQDGSAPTLSASLDGTLSFFYSDPTVNPWQCGEGGDGDVGIMGGGDAIDGLEMVQPCQPSGELPGEDAAIDALRTIIASTGRDPGTFEFTSETWEGAVTRSAQAWPVLGGQRLDQSWSVELTADGVFSSSGSLAPLVEIGEYPVVSAQQAFERLSDPRFGARMTNLPIALVREPAMVAVEPQWVPPTEPPATPSAGASLAWPVNDVEIVGARLGLASQWQPDGSVLVVPAYEFADAAGGTWTVIAVADSKLDFATE